MLLAGPFIETEGKQKITMASICDKNGNLCKTFPLSSRDIRGRPRSRGVKLRIILAFGLALIYYTQDFRVYERTRDQPMPGPFPAPPVFLREKPWGRG